MLKFLVKSCVVLMILCTIINIYAHHIGAAVGTAVMTLWNMYSLELLNKMEEQNAIPDIRE